MGVLDILTFCIAVTLLILCSRIPAENNFYNNYEREDGPLGSEVKKIDTSCQQAVLYENRDEYLRAATYCQELGYILPNWASSMDREMIKQFQSDLSTFWVMTPDKICHCYAGTFLDVSDGEPKLVDVHCIGQGSVLCMKNKTKTLPTLPNLCL